MLYPHFRSLASAGDLPSYIAPEPSENDDSDSTAEVVLTGATIGGVSGGLVGGQGGVVVGTDIGAALCSTHPAVDVDEEGES